MSVSGTAGITSFGAYIPRLRLNRASIAAAHKWAMPNLRGMAKGERSMCNWDEDAITMAVEASRDCLTGRDRGALEGIFFASTTLPFLDRQNAGVIGAALNLEHGIASLDVAGSQRAGTSALIAALRGAGDGETLVAAADARKARPASASEMQFGHGAAAVTVGRDRPVAVLRAHHTVTTDFVDHFRGEGEEFDYGWEERWVREEGYGKIVPQAIKALLDKAGVAGGDVAHFVMPCSLKGIPERTAKLFGVAPEAVADTMAESCGDTGAAHALLMLSAALEKAKPGDLILVVAFGQGADAILLEATEALADLPARHGVAGALAAGRREDDYMKFLSFQDNIRLDWGMRGETDNKTALSTEYRKKDMVTGFSGGRCTVCGTVQFPRTHYCVNPNCQALDTQEPYSFADSPARVMSFTADWLSYNPSPPFYYGQVQFETGGRVLMGFTDTEAGQLEVGSPLKMMFRIKDYDRDRGYRRYFWKAAPASPGKEA
ncbi:MAG: 3-hydroxy-3-methylglutaryl CoA synthase [Alphaproteobacteria bacterium]|nr:3-hydroxy-3-methylglutaryl CoA synthase [Alphaproteobacteria bacterium]